MPQDHPANNVVAVVYDWGEHKQWEAWRAGGDPQAPAPDAWFPIELP